MEENNEVRFIDALVNWLDMKVLGFKHAEPSGGAGRAQYDPRLLLALFIRFCSESRFILLFSEGQEGHPPVYEKTG